MKCCVPGLVCAALVSTTVSGQVPPPTFRSEARLVTVNASIQLGRRPLLGLTAADLVVLDNGVQQTVVRVDYATVPLDVTVIVDVSESSLSALKGIERDAARVTSFLRPTDRLRVLAVDTYVHELVPMSPVRTMTVQSPTTIGGWSAVHDSIAAALLVPAEPDCRQLVVALTDGGDNTSGTSPEQLVNIARATDSALVIVHTRLGPRSSGVTNRLPYLIGQPDLRALEEAARVTGGEVFRESAFGNNRIEAVEHVIEEFRQSYVLRYVTTGVEPKGWHDIEVRIKGRPDASVRARRGYFGG